MVQMLYILSLPHNLFFTKVTLFYFRSSIPTRWSWLASLKRFLLWRDSFYRFFRTWCLCWGTWVKCLVAPVPQLKSLSWTHSSSLSLPSSQNVMEYFLIQKVWYFGMVVSPQHMPFSQKQRRNQEKRRKWPIFLLSRNLNTCFVVESRRGTKATLFGWKVFVTFLAKRGQRLPGGACLGQNSGPSDSQPDAMTNHSAMVTQMSWNKINIYKTLTTVPSWRRGRNGRGAWRTAKNGEKGGLLSHSWTC